MSKVYKGYELIKAIADGEIKSGTQIRVHRPFGNTKYTIDYWFWGNWFGKEDGYSKPLDNIELFLCDRENTFELIEDEIDIDNIEELDTYETVETYDWQDVDTNRMTINELVQAVKQLNKEIKSIKEK